ncbi:MAG: hypothetical protein O3A95_06245 [Planctomycetota bacterium]|nr:hypothetical protein [Planctomycetota bacterium]MDA1113883.1 hypothetical protein [Planctomycetota bacterium]
MRHLSLFLYFTALAGVLLGVSECVGLALGGTTLDHFLAAAFLFIALGLGARHEGAGFVPLRASYALLGLAGVLPMLAGFAPLGAAFSVFLFLPIRATGARLAAALNTSESAVSLLALGAFFGWLITTAWAPGLPGFLGLWLVAGALQRYVIPAPRKDQATPTPSIKNLLPGLFAGAGVVVLFLMLSPYFALLDSGSMQQDLRRGLALGVVFFAFWLTFGSALGESKLRLHVAALSAFALAALVGVFFQLVSFHAQPEGYQGWLANARLLEWTQVETRALTEESSVYAPLLAIVMFGIPCALIALLLRTSIKTDHANPGPNFLSPLLGGAGVAFLAAAALPSATLFPSMANLTSALLFLSGAAALWAASSNKMVRAIGCSGALVAGAFLLPGEAPKHLQHPLVDAYVWFPKQHQADFFALPRVLERTSGQPEEDLDRVHFFDGRNQLSLLTEDTAVQRKEAYFAKALAGSADSICWVGIPNPQVAQVLLEGASQLTLACDPPSLARMALRNIKSEAFDFRRGLAHSDGPFDLVFMESSAMWESRHSLMRSELLRQASLRLNENGVCAFVVSPHELMPGLLPQWMEEFQDIFAQTSMFVLPDGLNSVRLLIAGRKPSEENAAWPLPAGEIALTLEELGLPLFDADDLESIEVQLANPVGAGHPFQFQGPFRPIDAALSPTAFQLIAELTLEDRASAVLAEMQSFELEGSTSLLGFYAKQFDAQEYSVHDTYLTKNPYATETSAEALDLLMQITKQFPNAAPLHRTWAEVGVGLVEAREVAWLDHYFNQLWKDFEWNDSEIRLALAHSAMELLDFELALEHLDYILERSPNFLPAKQLRQLAENEAQAPSDSHAGHNH